MEVLPAPRSALLILSLRQSYLHQNPSKHTLYGRLQQICQKKSISRQVDLVRLVLSIAEFG